MFVPGRSFQLSLVIVSKARRLTYSVANETCFARVGSGLTLDWAAKEPRKRSVVNTDAILLL